MELLSLAASAPFCYKERADLVLKHRLGPNLNPRGAQALADQVIVRESRTDKPTFIYGLIDPTTGELRYVGKTVKTVEQRRVLHIWQALNAGRKRHVLAWVAGLLTDGHDPEAVELEVVPAGADWEGVEQFWIAYFRFIGARLCNIAVGGSGAPGVRQSEQAKAARRSIKGAAHPSYGKKASERTRQKLSVAAQRKWLDPNWAVDQKRRMAAGRTPEAMTRQIATLAAYHSDPRRHAAAEELRLTACRTEKHRATVAAQSNRQWAERRDEIVAAQNAGKGPAYRRKQSELKKAQWRDPNSSYWKVFLSHETRDEIRAKLASGMTGTAVANLYGLSQSRVSQIKHGQ